jgi:hypothetical protein
MAVGDEIAVGVIRKPEPEPSRPPRGAFARSTRTCATAGATLPTAPVTASE